jgi:succinyl-diaminopimelate desuccinylase
MSLADTLFWLCSVASPIGQERALCDAVLSRCEQQGLAAPPRRYGDSLVVPVSRRAGAPHVILAGHLDVVESRHDGPVRIEGDRLYGPGAADMKSGLALMLALLGHGSALGVSLTLVFYAREEGPYADNELGDVLALDPELKHADVAVALEPSDNKLQLGCCGSLHASVTFSGTAAHSARPWQGDNAIYKAAPLLARLGALEPEPSQIDGLVYTNVITATVARGGRGRNIVPDTFELNLNHRFAPDTTLEAARARVSAIVAGDAEIQIVDESPAAPPHRSHPLIAALASSGVLAVEAKQAWTDVARFHLHDIPAVNFGPGVQAQAHQRNEWTLISQLDVGERILRHWLQRIAPG